MVIAHLAYKWLWWWMITGAFVGLFLLGTVLQWIIKLVGWVVRRRG